MSRAAWINSVEVFNLYELMDDAYHKAIAARDSTTQQTSETEPPAPAAPAAEADPKEKKIKALQKKVSWII